MAALNHPFGNSVSKSMQNSTTPADLQRLIRVFERCFHETENVRLQGGAAEPFYKAPANGRCAVIYFREDFFASALHEIAHWCIAGEKRRQMDDFGYWYKPEGRNAKEQAEFERVEVKPQALEWCFAEACAKPFYFSADNLSAQIGPSESFKAAVRAQKAQYQQDNCAAMPKRARQFYFALLKAFATEKEPCHV